MKRKISIRELREIGQHGREKEIWRVLSVYFTYFFIKVGLSANQVTFFGILPGIFGGILFIVGGFKCWFIGTICFLLSATLDRSDGEVARFNREESAEGNFLDSILHSAFMNSYLIVSAAVGLYRELSSIVPLILGLVSLAFLYINKNIDIFEHKRILLSTSTLDVPKNIKHTGKTKIFSGRCYPGIGVNKYILYESMRVVWLGLATLIDYIISLLAVKLLFIKWPINFRLLWLGFYTTVFLIGIIVRFHGNRKMLMKIDG